jgi:predicted nucleotidyltransferase
MQLLEIQIGAHATYHATLNPVVWTGDRMRPRVRQRLLTITRHFVDYLKVPGFVLHDVVLTGSMANYNWTRYSDVDLHLVTDFDQLQCDDIVEEFYQARRKLWNESYDIMIGQHQVELYVEDRADPPVSAGVFSVLDNTWRRRPQYNPPDFDDASIRAKVQDLVVQIQHALREARSDQTQKLMDRIWSMRQQGLERSGEYSTENLAFKTLRNLGHIDRLVSAYQQQRSQELSL